MDLSLKEVRQDNYSRKIKSKNHKYATIISGTFGLPEDTVCNTGISLNRFVRMTRLEQIQAKRNRQRMYVPVKCSCGRYGCMESDSPMQSKRNKRKERRKSRHEMRNT